MDTDVIVVGAGAAGLAAARTLAEGSVRVVLLEARDRIGGRAHSVKLSGELMPAELGAEFIHGPAEETKALLREAGTTYVDTGGESWLKDRHGTLHREDDEFLDGGAVFENVQALSGDVSVDEYLRAIEHDHRERATRARQFVEGFEGADPARASAKAIWAEVSTGVDAVAARPIGGYPPVIDGLFAAVEARKVEIHLSMPVTGIRWKRGFAEVTMQADGSAARTLRARAAIITVPVGVLRNGAITFEPALPTAVRHAASNIEMGHVVKVVLVFRNAFWETIRGGEMHDAGFFRSLDGPFQAYWTHVPVRSTIVSAWVGGPKADALAKLTTAERIEAALRGFGELLGDVEATRVAFVRGLTHDWSGDAFARGAYSYITTGGMGARERLAEPVDDTLFFAGEATSTNGQGGTVNGAIQTGVRAAREVLERL